MNDIIRLRVVVTRFHVTIATTHHVFTARRVRSAPTDTSAATLPLTGTRSWLLPFAVTLLLCPMKRTTLFDQAAHSYFFHSFHFPSGPVTVARPLRASSLGSNFAGYRWLFTFVRKTLWLFRFADTNELALRTRWTVRWKAPCHT